jgi:hypothetical protein
MAQFSRWRDGGGQAGMQAVGAAVRWYGQAAGVLAYATPSAANLSQLATAAAALQARAQQAQADPPPGCLAGLRSSYTAALADFARAGHGARDSARALQSGDLQRADSDAQVSTSALVAGAQAMRKYAQDMAGIEASR